MGAFYTPGNSGRDGEFGQGRELQSKGILIPQNIGQAAYYNKEPVHVSDVRSLLLKERIIFVPAAINSQVAKDLVGMLLYLESDDATKDIHLYINCYGSTDGSLYQGLAIYDTMQYLKPDISTLCVGMAVGVAAMLLAAATKGKRYCLPHSSIVLHQPLSEVSGQASDIEIRTRELLRQRRALYEILAKHTGQTVERITQDADRMNFLSAQEAVDYGLADEIIMQEDRPGR